MIIVNDTFEPTLELVDEKPWEDKDNETKETELRNAIPVYYYEPAPRANPQRAAARTPRG
jgi:hypothetical protein